MSCVSASTSSIINQETDLANHQDPLTQGVSTDFNLQPMETVRLRWIETMAEEPLATRLARIEAHIKGCIFRGSSCERWTNKHETQLTWATDWINEARREQDELTMKVQELNELLWSLPPD